MSLRPQLLSALGLLALLPVVIYLFDLGETSVALAAVNVVLIVGSVYYMFSPAGSPENGSRRPA